MRRREFITLVGGAAAWPLAARSQEARKLPTIGFMGSDAAFFSPWTAAFAGRLRELGWVEGRTISIEYRWSEGRPERVDAIAAEFVGLNVDVIVTAGGAAAAFKRATSVIPIVFAVATDPLGSGLVDSLARPGGNVTGLSNLQAELAGKRLELLREFIPRPTPRGSHGKCWLSVSGVGDGRGADRGAEPRARILSARNPASGGHCSRLRRPGGGSLRRRRRSH